MYPAERHQKIIEILRKKGRVNVEQLSSEFNMSRSTIRRDLNDLEKQGLVKTHYGGACFIEDHQPSFFQRESSGQKSKQAIAQKALSLINQDECLLIDAGTTLTEFAFQLNQQVEFPLTVMSTALNIIQALEKNKNIYKIVAGGIFRDSNRSLVGHLTEIAFDQIRIDKAFIGAGGIDLSYGLSNFNPNEAQTRKKMIEEAGQVIILTDSSKFGKRALVSIAPLEDIDIIVTDNNISHFYRQELVSKGIKIIEAEVDNDEDKLTAG